MHIKISQYQFNIVESVHNFEKVYSNLENLANEQLNELSRMLFRDFIRTPQAFIFEHIW